MKFKILSLCMALAMAFTCAFGLTACGNAVSVKYVEITADGELLITMTDGSKSNLGKITGNDGADGADGKDGVGISGANIDADGNLILVMTDGTIKNLGRVTGGTGSNGADGKDGVGISTAYVADGGKLIIVLTDGKTVDCGLVVGVPEKTDADFLYEEVGENGAVTGYAVTGLANAFHTALVIPSELNNKPVVGIKDGAFSGCGEIVSVTIPDSVKTIGANAFSDCVSLKNISFGNGVVSVGNTAFARCKELENVNVSDIGAWCGIKFSSPSSNPLYFAGNLYLNNVLVTNLTVPDTVTAIGDFAFYECDKIKSVNTGNAKAIGASAFYNCAALESLTAGGALESIGEMAFADCANLKDVNFGGVKEIGGFSFQNCASITELSIPSSVNSIGESAFTDCKGLKNLKLNNGIKTIGDCAFGGCSSLEKFIMPDSITSLGFGVLMNNEGGFEDNGEMSGISEIKISASLTEIPDYAFSRCGIKTITIGSAVRKINYSSFYDCGLLESVIIPVSVNHIASYSFYKCEMLKSIYYAGSEESWKSVFVGKNGNTKFREADVYFYSAEEPAQSVTGARYWRYVNGVPAVW